MWASALDAIFEVFLGRLEHCSAPGLSPDFAHPQFPPKGVLLYTSHLSRKDRTGLMNSYHIPRDYIASMASTARMQDRSLWVACWTTDAWQWCGIAALEYILHYWVVRSQICTDFSDDIEPLLQRNGHVSWKGHKSVLNVVRQCGEFVLDGEVVPEWLMAKDSRFPFNLPVRRG